MDRTDMNSTRLAHSLVDDGTEAIPAIVIDEPIAGRDQTAHGEVPFSSGDGGIDPIRLDSHDPTEM
jgi:hypothetical protein